MLFILLFFSLFFLLFFFDLVGFGMPNGEAYLSFLLFFFYDDFIFFYDDFVFFYDDFIFFYDESLVTVQEQKELFSFFFFFSNLFLRPFCSSPFSHFLNEKLKNTPFQAHKAP